MANKKSVSQSEVSTPDWRERTTAQQKRYIKLSIGAFVLAFILCIFLFYQFQYLNYQRIVKQNRNYIQDSATQESDQIEHDMKSASVFIGSLANQYANLSREDKNTSVKEKLAVLEDKNIFDRIAFVSPDGTDTSLAGVANVSDREYFRKAMRGESGWQMIRESRVTGEPTVVFYSPVLDGDKIMGVMIGFYEQNKLEELFTYELFHFTPHTYLLLGDGTEVANSNSEEAGGNMLRRLSQKKFIGDTDFKGIQEAIADEKRTTVTFSYVDGRETLIGVIVQFRNSDWMMLSILPSSITENMVNGANQIGMKILVAVIVVFLVLIFILIFFLRKQRDRLKGEMSVVSENLVMTTRNQQRQLSVIESLGDMYSSIYYIDLNEGLYHRVREKEDDAMTIPAKGEAGQGIAAYVDMFVSGVKKEELNEFLDIDTFRKRLKKDKTVMIEYQRTDQKWRRAVIVPAVWDEEGVLTAVVFAVQKIDKEKKKELETQKALQEAYEAASMASRAKTAFLSNMSHDIRTPMNAIVGMTAIAAANLDNKNKISDCLKKITSSSRHLLALINEVLDMSKIESGKVDLCEEGFRLSDLIDDLITIHQPLIQEKNHTLVVKVNNLQHEDVVGDSTRLQQVFSNLLSNAIKYTPANGRIEIIISEKEANKPSIGWYQIVIRDNGIGMTEEYQKNLFEPFTRADDKRINGIQGTGLGMPIARNIIKMMNGDITVESQVDKGTAFTVSFSLRLRPEAEVKKYEHFIDLPVLVVDDDAIACESTCTMLNGLSMNSEWVTSGREAVEKTVEHHQNGQDYYAVIIDWKMPDMNGIETTKEIRRQIGDDVPIVVMSAYDWSEIEQEARRAGVNAFLSKPLFKSRVIDLFCELLGDDSEGKGSEKDEGIAQYDFSGRRVLLAEDNEINAEIAVELLSMSGLETETAENGKICLDKFSNSTPGYYDLILMDVQMPVMNGYEATVAIRALSHPDAKKIPIIAMTANAFASDVRDAMSSGMNGHIAKPIDVEHMINILKEHI